MRRKRLGFTIIELLVVIAIIGILVALLLPAVQAAREAANRAQCESNLKQLAIAAQNYNDVYKQFPPGGTRNMRFLSGWDNWTCWSAHSMMLPYLEQQNLYDQINFNFVPFDNLGVANRTYENVRLSVFLCPSDSKRGDTLNNYHSCYGTTTNSAVDNSSGIFWIRSAARIADIEDGTANTIAFGEALRGDQRGGSKYRGNVLMNANGGSSPTGSRRFDAFESPMEIINAKNICETEWNNTSIQISVRRGFRWSEGVTGFTLFNMIQTPNESIGGCRFGCNSGCYLDDGFMYGASSNHGSGANVVFADGHVETVSDDIDRFVWWSKGTKAGGESYEK